MTNAAGFDLERLVDSLSGVVDNVVAFSHTDSTHACALRLIEQADLEEIAIGPTVVAATTQTQGAGRGNRGWASPPGGLYLNWIRLDLDAAAIVRLPMVAASAAHRAVAACCARPVGIKWPNDLVADGRKLAGILVHARRGPTSAATVGLGVNLTTTPDAGPDALLPSTCLADLVDDGPDPEHWATSIAHAFVAGLDDATTSPKAWIDHWREQLVHRPGDPIRLRLADGGDLRGRFVGTDEHGFMTVATDSGERTVTGGDVVEFVDPT